MPLDPRRLARDAKTLEAKRPAAAIGRETTGVTRAVRALMPVIRELRQAGVRWGAIAEALAQQGIVGPDGQPMQANRLTAVVDRVEQGEQRKAAKTQVRQRDHVPDRGGPPRTYTTLRDMILPHHRDVSTVGKPPGP